MTTTYAPSATALATDKQIAFIVKLGGILHFTRSDRAFASNLIGYLLSVKPTAPIIVKPAQIVAKPAGASKGEWHFVAGTFYLVAMSQGSGKLYAKARCAGGGFDYAPGMVGKLSAATIVGPQHAEMVKAFGSQWDACMFCMKPLDVPESRLAGCGKVCADKHGMPYGN